MLMREFSLVNSLVVLSTDEQGPRRLVVPRASMELLNVERN